MQKYVMSGIKLVNTLRREDTEGMDRGQALRRSNEERITKLPRPARSVYMFFQVTVMFLFPRQVHVCDLGVLM